MLRSGKDVHQVEAEAAHLSLRQGKVLGDIAARNRRSIEAAKDKDRTKRKDVLWRKSSAAPAADAAAEKLRSVEAKNALQQQRRLTLKRKARSNALQQQRRLTLKRKAADAAAAKSQKAAADAAVSRYRETFLILNYFHFCALNLDYAPPASRDMSAELFTIGCVTLIATADASSIFPCLREKL